MSEINVTPLTDVLLVLLITFLLSATAFESGDVIPPLPRVVETEQLEAEAIIVNVDRNGAILGPDASRLEESPEQLFARLPKDAARPTLALAVHRELAYGKLYPLLTAAQQAGWEQIVLLTELRR